ncbi:MAG: hypothetical protein FJ206_15465 [Gemmatimonadetes bacterium]|nr:hypothetical protein [Gemmatimonadota bacterium]
MVLCRNVLIYYGPDGQSRILPNLVRSLRQGGLLVLGKAEAITPADDLGIEAVDRTERIYRRCR